MPECQLRRLSNLIDQVSTAQRDLALWVDNLCVPVHSKRHRLTIVLRVLLDLFSYAEYSDIIWGKKKR